MEGVKINPLYSINEDNEVIDYDGNTIAELDDIFVKENGVLYLISNVTYDKSSDTLKYEKYNSVTGVTNVLSTNNNLYSIWKDILGGEYSCDENGVYGEQSMDTMTILLNRLGNRLNNTDSIDSQNNIDQYAKKAIVHYFPTSSSQKSAKTPVVDLRVAEKDLSKRYTTKMNIENFGIQLDPDHSAEDGEIHEITQLISFITENNYVPEKVKRIYQNLSKMVSILKEKTFIDPMSMVDENARRIAQEKLDNLFGKKIERIFADPTLDVMGLANELMREIQHLNPKLPSPYKAPYSDHQMLGKLHTTVGSYFNKFIARLWSGRGDVLVPSHNMCMLYEDESGITYFKDDIKYLPDGTEMNIKDYLRSLVWEDESKSLIREDYIEAEERVVKELKELNKPFVIVLNSVEPDSDYTQTLAQKLQEKYDTQVIPTDCENLTADKIDEIFGKVLYEFPIERVNISFPRWVDGLPETHWLKEELYDEIKDAFKDIKILKQIDNRITKLQNTEVISTSIINEIQLGTGSINITINLLDDLFYKVLTEISGVPITNEGELFSSMISFANVKKEYDKVSTALQEVNTKGYGIVSPSIDELILEEPEMVKQGTRYGVKLRAKAPSIHMIRADIETEVSPIVGSEKQSQELVESLLSEFENDPKKIWESNIFGKSLHELVNEGLQTKLMKMPEDAQEKLQETLERIINEGSGGLICIIL